MLVFVDQLEEYHLDGPLHVHGVPKPRVAIGQHRHRDRRANVTPGVQHLAVAAPAGKVRGVGRGAWGVGVGVDVGVGERSRLIVCARRAHPNVRRR